MTQRFRITSTLFSFYLVLCTSFTEPIGQVADPSRANIRSMQVSESSQGLQGEAAKRGESARGVESDSRNSRIPGEDASVEVTISAPVMEVKSSPLMPTIAYLASREPVLFENIDLSSLRRFGDEIFDILPGDRSRLSLQQAVVPDSYRLGPGDELEVHFWNQTQNEMLRSTVSQDGRIAFPLAGEVSVAGVVHGELRNVLLNQLRRYYTEIDLSFRILRLRTFPVFLTGEVERPGMVIANALMSPIRLLMFQGGPGPRGSFRSFHQIRSGKIVQTFDLYSLLMEGLVNTNVYFQPDDVLHIPLAKRRVALLGAIRRPGIFELEEGESLQKLLKFGGGFEGGADRSLLQVIRFNLKGQAMIEDLDSKVYGSTLLGDGDVAIAHIIQQPIQNKVQVDGHVFRPGIFEWTDGLNVAKLVEKAQGLPSDAYLQRAELFRSLLEKATFRLNEALSSRSSEEIIPLNLSHELSGKESTPVRPGDRLVVYSLEQVQTMPSVEVVGSVNLPGDYPLYGKTRVADILFLAQLNESSYMLRGEIHRRGSGGIEVLPFHLENAIKEDFKENLLLENGDIISIFSDPERMNEGKVYLQGMVQFPGTYPFQMGERLADVLKRAGGIRQEGYLRAARFLRQSVRERQILARDEYIAQERSRLESLKVEITQQEIDDKERKRSLSGVDQVTTLVDRLAGSDILGRIQLDFRGVSTLEEIKISEMNISLEDGDVFEVPGIPSEVTILGQVYSPSTVLHRKNLKLNDFLSLAGGFTEFAHKESIYILKADGSATPARKARTKTRHLAYVKGALGEDSSSYRYVVEPGDTIVVPAKLRMRHDRFQRTLDAVYKSAISVGALAGLFK